MKQSNKLTVIFIFSSLLLLIGGLILAIRLGSVPINFQHIWDSIFNYSETLELMLIRDVRIPRALAVLFTGGILGVTGCMIQGVTRNPIAEPSILGVSQGATLIIAIFYAMGIGINITSVMMAALIGALFTGLIVLGFISRKAKDEVGPPPFCSLHLSQLPRQSSLRWFPGLACPLAASPFVPLRHSRMRYSLPPVWKA